MEPWMVTLVILVAVIALVVYVAARPKAEVKRQPERAQKERDIKLRKASPNINVPGVTPLPIDPVPAAPNGTIGYGDKLDKVGDPAKARLVSLLRSNAWLLPEATLFKPGDEVMFRARIVDEQDNPIEGVPVFWRLHAQRRDLNLPVRTDAEGIAEAGYTVREQDMIEAGSYIVMTYAGGRAILKKLLLHDVLQPKIDPDDPFFQGS